MYGSHRSLIEKVVIFIVGFFSRLFLGFVFYGSIDTKAYLTLANAFLTNTLVSRSYLSFGSVNFPVIPYHLWFACWVNHVTGLAPVFCVKIVPIFFDALIGLLIYGMVRRLRPNCAFLSALLYALSPISLITTCIHGQWESMPLYFFILGFFVRDYFTDSYTKYFVFGLLFAFSILIKPMAIIFLPFFFVPSQEARRVLGRFLLITLASVGAVVSVFFVFFKMDRKFTVPVLCRSVSDYFLHHPVLILVVAGLAVLGMWLLYAYLKKSSKVFLSYLRYASMSIAGFMIFVAVCLALFIWYGFTFGMMMDNLLRYLNQGGQVIGLPFAYPFSTYPLILIVKNRFWLMGLITVVAWLYYRQKIDLFSAMAMSLALVFGIGGGSPQYFVWLLPLLLIRGYYAIAIVYNLVLTSFFFLYYMNPWSNPGEPYQSMGAFAARKGFAWFMPSAFWAQERMTPIMHLFGNYLMPIMFIIIAVFIWRIASRNAVVAQVQEKTLFAWSRCYYLIVGFIPTVLTALLIYYSSDIQGIANSFDMALKNQDLLYHVRMVTLYTAGIFDQAGVVNVITVLTIVSILWILYSLKLARTSE